MIYDQASIKCHQLEAPLTPAKTFIATRAFTARTSQINSDGASLEGSSIQSFNGRFGLRLLRHFNKAKALGLVGKFVLNYRGGGDFAVVFERFSQIAIRDLVGKISNIHIHYKYT